MSEETKVKDYFTRAAKEFDDIYDDRGGPIKKLANRLFRKGMRERFELTLQYCGSGDRSVLDIGCGAGRFTIPLAERGMKG
jgi:ubiquinone/menaquinone biosynthesis C-methylase UbiE